MPDLQRSRCSICYGPRAFRGPALLLRFFYKQRVTCEKNDVCATVTIDADFDRQIHNNNNNNMRAVKRVVYR